MVQLRSLPTYSELQSELHDCQIELEDVLAERDAAGLLVAQRRTAAVQELLEARDDLTLVYASIQEDIDRVGEEITHLRRLVDTLGSGAEGESTESRQQDFCRVRLMIESAQAALTSLEDRQKEVFARITALQVLLAQQVALESALERHRVHRISVLEQNVKEIVTKMNRRKSLESLQRHQNDMPREQPSAPPDTMDVDTDIWIRHHSINPS